MHPCQDVNGAYVLEEKCRSLLRGYDFLYCLNFFYSKHCFYNEETIVHYCHLRRLNPISSAAPVSPHPSSALSTLSIPVQALPFFGMFQ